MPEEAAPQRDGELSATEPSENPTPAATTPASRPAASEEPTEVTDVTESTEVDGAAEPTEVIDAAGSGGATVILEKSSTPPAADPAVAADAAVVGDSALAGQSGAGDGAQGFGDDAPGAGDGAQGFGGASGLDDAPGSADMLGPAGAPHGRRGVSKIFAIVVGLIVLLVVGCGISGAVLYLNKGKPTTAAVGDCLKGDGINPGNRKTSNVSLKTIGCDSSGAKYKVVGRVENQPESAATADSKLCDPFTGTEFIYWEGVSGERGTVLCLTTNSKK